MSKSNGNPRTALLSSDAYARLIEDPTSLNLQASTSPAVILKNKIREELYLTYPSIKHAMFKESIKYSKDNRLNLIQFLIQIRPMFPRFFVRVFLGVLFGNNRINHWTGPKFKDD